MEQLMPGPAPKPTALKLLQGNPGKRKLNDQEPKPAVGAVAPKYVQDSPVLLAEWNRHAPRLTKLKLLTEIDDDALATLCVLEVRFREMVGEEASTSGLSFLSKEKRALWSRFGMTPADRSRVKVAEPDGPKAKMDKFRAG
jgi:phage terminase small subunit